MDPLPLSRISSIIELVGRKLRCLLILDLLRKDQIEDQGHESRDGETRLKHALDGVEKTGQAAVVAGVSEDVAV